MAERLLGEQDKGRDSDTGHQAERYTMELSKNPSDSREEDRQEELWQAIRRDQAQRILSSLEEDKQEARREAVRRGAALNVGLPSHSRLPQDWDGCSSATSANSGRRGA